MRELHGPELAGVRDAVQAVIEDVCARGDHPVPALRIVDKLRSGATNTAQASIKGKNGSIRVPASLALFMIQSMSRDALEHLMAHELGHIVHRRSRWARARSWLIAGMFTLLIASLVTPVLAALSGDQWLPLMTVPLLIAGFTTIPAWHFANREHESECDVFAVRLQGHLNGAAELMHDYERRRRERGQARPGWLLRLVATHPDPMRRLSIMRDALAATSTQDGRRTIRG